MYNQYNPYSNPMERIDNQIKELQNLKKSYQNMPQQPMNVFNVNATTPQIDFEARILNENEKPSEIIVTRKTAFIDLKNGVLSIKEINGDIKEYKIILPKDEKDLKIEELERRINELSTINQYSTANEKNEKSSKGDDNGTTKNSK